MQRILAVLELGRRGATRLQMPVLKEPLPKIVITHAVKDVETWLKGKAERVEAFAPFASHVTDHVAMDGSNNVAVTADVHDMAAAQAMMTTPSPRRPLRPSVMASSSR